MPSPEYYKERAEIFTALASFASNVPMARLYAWMAAEFLAKAQGEESSVDDVPAIILGPSALAG